MIITLQLAAAAAFVVGATAVDAAGKPVGDPLDGLQMEIRNATDGFGGVIKNDDGTWTYQAGPNAFGPA